MSTASTAIDPDTLPHEGWRLHIVFRPPDEQAELDPESVFPHDDVTNTLGFVTRHWGALPEDLDEFAVWNEREIAIVGSVLEACAEVVAWASFYTLPERIVLERW